MPWIDCVLLFSMLCAFGSSRVDATSEETEDVREHYAAEDFAYPPDTRGEHSLSLPIWFCCFTSIYCSSHIIDALVVSRILSHVSPCSFYISIATSYYPLFVYLLAACRRLAQGLCRQVIVVGLVILVASLWWFRWLE